MKYSVVEISGRQYLVKPGEILLVDKLSEEKTLTADKVLLSVNEDQVKVGQPFLAETLNFKVLETVKQPKVRVATYKAKANYRRVKGQRQEMTRIQLTDTQKPRAVKKED